MRVDEGYVRTEIGGREDFGNKWVSTHFTFVVLSVNDSLLIDWMIV